MSYDAKLAQRVRQLLRRRQGVDERKMFGGVAFMLNGNMCCGVNKDDLMVRVMPEECDAALKRPHAHVFDLTGKPMKGFVLVTPKGYSSDKALKEWIEMGVKCARSLLAKAAKKKPRKK